MFIGHFGVGFAAKKFAPTVSLGWLFLSAQFLDLLWPTLLLAGVEHVEIAPGITKVTPLDFVHYPITHSLLAVIGWGLLFGAIARSILKNNSIAIVIFLCVVSHWFLDLLVHRPDLPLLPGNDLKLGFGLWNYPILTAILEAIVFLPGVFYYTKVTTPKNKAGKYSLMGLVIFLIFIQVANMAGPPPPSVEAIAVAGHLQWLFVLFAFYVDRNRRANISAT